MRRWRVLIGLIVMLVPAVVLLGRAGSGPGVRTIAPGWNMLSLVVDSRTGQAFIDRPNSARVYVLDIATGVRLRTVVLGHSPTPVFVSRMAVAEQAGRVFATTRHFVSTPATRDTMSVLDARSGTILRTVTIPGGGFFDNVIADERTNRVLLLTSFSPAAIVSVTVFDAASGRVMHTGTVNLQLGVPCGGGSRCMSGPAVSVSQQTGRIYVTNVDLGMVGVLDGTNGRLVRTITANPAGWATATGPGFGPAAVDEHTNRLFLRNFARGTVSTFDLTSGRLLRTVRIGGAMPAEVDERTQRVFVYHAGVVSVLDAASGRLLHTVMVGHMRSFFYLVVDNRTGRVFLVDSQAGLVSTLDGVSGRLLRTVGVGQNIGFAGMSVDEATGCVVVSSLGPLDHAGNFTSKGTVSVLDGHSGAILHASAVGINPSQLALDQRAGHAIVLNAGGPTNIPDAWVWVPAWLRPLVPFLPPPMPHQVVSSISVLTLPR